MYMGPTGPKLRRARRWVVILSTATLLQTGSCALTSVDAEQLTGDVQNITAVVVGNLVTNTLAFFLNNAWIRAVG